MNRARKTLIFIGTMVAGIIGACSNDNVPLTENNRRSKDIPKETVVFADNAQNNTFSDVYDPVVRFAVVSDLNGSYGTIGYSSTVKRGIRSIVERRPDFVLGCGDYVAGQKAGLNYQAMWKSFQYDIDDVLFDAGIPFAGAPGNHDASGYDAYAEEREHFKIAMHSRKPPLDYVSGGNYPFYYGFIFRNILILVLDLTTPFRVSDEQLLWLEETLLTYKNINVKIALGHLPLRPVALAHYSEIVGSRELENIFRRHRLSLYLSGHHHSFYPAHLDGLRTTSVGCLGSGARSLFELPSSWSTKSANSYVWLEANTVTGSVNVKAFTGENFEHEISLTALPETLGVLRREDLDTTPYKVDSLEREIIEHDAVSVK